MKFHRLQILKEFTCLGSKCPQDCCSNWELPLQDIDISFYEKNTDVLGELREHFDFENKKICLSGTSCANLNTDGLCQLQVNKGHRALPLACKEYPRIFIQNKGDIWLLAKTSCPEIVNLIFTHEKLVFLSPIKKLIHHSLLFPIQKEKLQIYLQNMSFLTRKTLLHFYVEQYKGAYHFFPPRQTLSENQSIYVMIYKMKNILEVKSHFDAFVPLFNRTLQEEHYQLSDNVFLEKTKERFDQIPVESRELIWQGFANSLYLYSFNLVVSHSVSESYVGQSIYSFTVLTLGIWNQKFQDIEHWKKVIYNIGRCAQPSTSKDENVFQQDGDICLSFSRKLIETLY